MSSKYLVRQNLYYALAWGQAILREMSILRSKVDVPVAALLTAKSMPHQTSAFTLPPFPLWKLADSVSRQMCALQRNFDLCIPRKETARPQSQFQRLYVSVSDSYIPTIGPPVFLQQNMQMDWGLTLSHPFPFVVNYGGGGWPWSRLWDKMRFELTPA